MLALPMNYCLDKLCRSEKEASSDTSIEILVVAKQWKLWMINLSLTQVLIDNKRIEYALVSRIVFRITFCVIWKHMRSQCTTKADRDPNCRVWVWKNKQKTQTCMLERATLTNNTRVSHSVLLCTPGRWTQSVLPF